MISRARCSTTGSKRLEAAMSLFSLAEKAESVCRIKFIGQEDSGRSPEKSKLGGLSRNFGGQEERKNIF
jgi:hypothetical protein